MKMSGDECVRFIREVPFATVTSASPLQTTHIPLQLADDSSQLTGHMAKANPHWHSLDGREVLIVFSGPHAYISGTDYVSCPAVPTWNYAAVHVTANCRVLASDRNHAVTASLLRDYEPDWAERSDVYQQDYIERLNKAIVALTFDIVAMEGKLKLGQQKSTEDQRKVYNRLCSSDLPGDQQLAQFMAAWNTGTGGRNKDEA